MIEKYIERYKIEAYSKSLAEELYDLIIPNSKIPRNLRSYFDNMLKPDGTLKQMEQMKDPEFHQQVSMIKFEWFDCKKGSGCLMGVTPDRELVDFLISKRIEEFLNNLVKLKQYV